MRNSRNSKSRYYVDVSTKDLEKPYAVVEKKTKDVVARYKFKEEAEELALKEIEEKGIEFKNGWKTGYNADYGVTDVEEVA